VTKLRQYELRWADMPEPLGRRPVLLLSRTAAFEYLNKAIVAEITTTIRNIPQEVSLGRREGLSRPSVANLDNVHVVAKTRLRERISVLDPGRTRQVKRALGYALEWPELKILS
jgi:mRNA interferase MazF